jgi:hypothetical protein
MCQVDLRVGRWRRTEEPPGQRQRGPHGSGSDRQLARERQRAQEAKGDPRAPHTASASIASRGDVAGGVVERVGIEIRLIPALLFQPALEERGDVLFILDNENPHRPCESSIVVGLILPGQDYNPIKRAAVAARRGYNVPGGNL